MPMKNLGAILRRMFPQMFNTQAQIVAWTIVLILNIVLIALLQNYQFLNIKGCTIKELASIYIACGVLLLGLEGFLWNKFSKKNRDGKDKPYGRKRFTKRD